MLFLLQLPTRAESGTAAAAEVAAAAAAGAPSSKTSDDIGVARPLAPPEVGHLSDEEDEEAEEEEDSEVDGEEEEEEPDEALVEAVETLLREVEVRLLCKAVGGRNSACVRWAPPLG